jgi:pentapeptide MXKDX repeat protein
MNLVTRLSLLACAAALALGMVLASPDTYAQGTMGKDDMKKGEMKGEMKDPMKKDAMSDGSMKKDEKKDMMKKDDMKK